MLVLTRKQQEAIRFVTSDGLIRVTVFEVTGTGAVRLGIEAPASVQIVRDELATARGVQPAQPEQSGDAPLPLASAGGV